MQQWRAFPFVRYVAWLLAGILLAFQITAYQQMALLVGVLSFIALAILLFIKTDSANLSLVKGLLIFVMLFSVGYWRTAAVLEVPVPQTNGQESWWVQVKERPVATPKSYRFRAELSVVKPTAEVYEVMVYLPKALNAKLPAAGELLLVRGRLQPVAGPSNPYEFDYRAYLASKGINYQLFAQAYVSAGEGEMDMGDWQRTAFKSRDYLMEIIRQFIPDREVGSVVSAMVLGQRTELDRDLQQAYSSAGVMHVLAVSGLHVGMVAGIFFWFFRYVGRDWRQRVLWLLLVLFVLWSYAWLTGLAPSSLRATLMFSVIAMGKAVKRKGNIYNSIALSAFVLLLFDPLLIRQVGFQLSYLAVLGIVYMQPRINNWYQPAHKFKKKLWELFAVTLAAQLATFPLGLYYFHQFPTYFFIGNFLAVPLAGLILYSTLGLLALHWIPFLNMMIAYLVNAFAVVLNLWVRFTEAIPASKIIATLTAWETILIYGAMLCLLILLRRRSFFWAVASFVCLVSVAVGGLVKTYERRQQQSFIAYQIPGHTLLHFINGRQEVLMPVGVVPKEQQLGYHVSPARLQFGYHEPLTPTLLPQEFKLQHKQTGGYHLLVWQGYSIALIEGKVAPMLVEQPIAVDMVLLRKNPTLGLAQIKSLFNFKNLIVDASSSRRYRERIKSQANSLNLPIYITSEQGAYFLQR